MKYEYASLPVRLAALCYESLLVAAVTFFALLVASPVAFFLRSFTELRTILIGLILLIAWYAYFLSAWQKRGQTLAMKTWRLFIRAQSKKQLSLRFLWAMVFVVLLPAVAYLAARQLAYRPLIALGLALVWWILPFGWAILHREKQFLYDFLAGTELVRLPKD